MKKLWALCSVLFLLTVVYVVVNQPPARSYDSYAENVTYVQLGIATPPAQAQPSEPADGGAAVPDETGSVPDTQENSESGLPLLVNHGNPLEKSYVPDDLVKFKKTGYYLTEECANALAELQSAAAEQKMSMPIKSGYRSYNTQDTLYKRKVTAFRKTYEKTEAEEQAARVVAKPGLSEHQTGLAADVGTLTQSFGNTKEGKWLAENCWKYGFIIRYASNKVDITGYIYEPWHIRYVSIEHAKIMYENDWCLEEYMEYRNGL